jgi:uncharacterized protein
LKRRIASFVALVQGFLFFGHWFIYKTWTVFWQPPDPPGIGAAQIAFIALSLSFVVASLLAFRYANFAVRLLYRIASIWLGFMNFCFMAAWLCWAVYLSGRLSGHAISRPAIAGTLFTLAGLFAIYGIVNAAWIRVRKITVQLPGLPESWQGRTAALATDTHLGHVHGAGFTRRIVKMLKKSRPDIVFLVGDLYDGTKLDADLAAAPWKDISPTFGKYFVTGNHEEFSDPRAFLSAIERSGIRVLNNEMTIADGLQIVGVHHHDTTHPDRFRSILASTRLDLSRASILLSHAPHALEVGEQAGISLQLSGHTHGGQIFPITWITRRIFRRFTYGLQRLGNLQVYTSYGAGTWGPPMRVGSHPEIVLITLESAGPKLA